MIAKISRGWKIGGLLRYLMGPGRANEHTDPHVVASWDGDPLEHQPPALGEGVFDVRSLVDELSAAAFGGGVALVKPRGEKVPQGPVWHCSLRNDASDRVLSDAEWARVVADVMDATGIAPHGDEGGCRWVAVRHAPDHVHIAAVLVREDTLARVYPFRDYQQTRVVMEAAEMRLGLMATAPADRTAVGASTRAEMEKAAARGLVEPPREWLRRAARVAAVQAHEPRAYFQALQSLGVMVAPRLSDEGELLGYSVASPGDVNAEGLPVWFSGSTLAQDLSLPRLRARWESTPAPTAQREVPESLEASVVAGAVVAEAVSAMERAAATLAVGEDDGGGGDAGGIVHAVEDMLAAVTVVTSNPFSDAGVSPPGGPVDVYQRAARQAGVGQPTRWGRAATDLRGAAWQLAGVGMLAGMPGGGAASANLVVALASLIAEVAAYHETRQHLAQARAACTAGRLVADRRPPGRPEQA
nr:hypothetical protein [Actinomycetota bacterium]